MSMEKWAKYEVDLATRGGCWTLRYTRSIHSHA